jgi:ABC-type phosphate transport system ATPase subunit
MAHAMQLSTARYIQITIQITLVNGTYEELDGPAISALRRTIAEVKQRWSVIGWVTKNLLS